MVDIRIPPDRISAVEKVLSDPADDFHTAFQAYRRRIQAAATSEVMLAQWEADPHANAQHLGELVTARLQTTELITLLYHSLNAVTDDAVPFLHHNVIAEWERCVSCRRATRVSLRHIFSGTWLPPHLLEDEEP